MDVIAYLRVSTEGQAGEDRFGLPLQRTAIENFAASNGMKVIRWYSDEGVSGTTIHRPEIQKALAEVASLEVKVLLVAKLDRLARDLYAQLWFEKEFLRAGEVEIVSAAEPFRGQDPMNKCLRQVIGAFAELERSVIVDRLGSGRKKKAQTGGFAGGVVPLGYRRPEKKGPLDVDEEKAAVVKKIFALKRRHPTWSLQQIADRVNDLGYTTARGKAFRPTQIKRVLDNAETYKGTYQYAGITASGAHTAII